MRRATRKHGVWLVGAVIGLWLATSCSSSAPDSSEPAAPAADGAPVESVATTVATTSPPNRPPELRVPSSVRADVGETWSDAIVASDPDGDSFTIWFEDRPRDLFATTTSRGIINGFEWQPTEAGQWFATVVVADSSGAQTRQTIELLGRYPRAGDLFVALGDSLAAGFGRDRSDFVSGDGCFRSEGDAYPALVFETMVAAGSLSGDASFVTAACRGARAGDLAITPVGLTDERGDRVDADVERSQVEWAIRLNPTVITLTVGADDVGLSDPDVVARGLEDTDLDQLEAALGEHLATIIASTDAHVAVTTYPEVAAVDPKGLDDCARQCFAEANTAAWREVTAAIESAVSTQSTARISVVDLTTAFETHRSANGIGPDIIRGLFDGPSNAFCADGDGPDETWVSRIDCWHPNTDGHDAIAEAVVATLFEL